MIPPISNIFVNEAFFVLYDERERRALGALPQSFAKLTHFPGALSPAGMC
jgi:hypothetical protein